MGGTDCDHGPDGEGEATTQFQANYDWAAVTPSHAIIEALAHLENTDLVALATDKGMTLHEYVNPDALDTLVTNQQTTELELTATIDGYTVRIRGTELAVEPTERTE